MESLNISELYLNFTRAEMDYVHSNGVELIQQIQVAFQDNRDSLLFVSKLADPRAAFLVYFPITFIFKPTIGAKVAWTAAISELFNSVFKWFLYGHRPYWWVYETAYYKGNPPILKHYRLTCETGPGSPSGHCMVTAAVMYVLVVNMLRLAPKKLKLLTTIFAWTAYVMFITAICVSRTFIATHFPHQVIAGSITGILLGVLVDRKLPRYPFITHYVGGALFVLVMGFSVYQCLIKLGMDPFWSVRLAKRHCENPKWVTLDTTIFFAIVKDSSALLGVGIGMLMHTPIPNPDKMTMTFWMKVIAILNTLALTQGSEYFKPSPNSPTWFYSLAYLKHGCIMYLVVLIYSVFIQFGGYPSRVRLMDIPTPPKKYHHRHYE